ncbi:MAG: SpoIIE family protein phosphatase, partial [Bacteroidota bacterium]
SYGEQEGFTPMEVCHSAITKDNLGNLFFGTVAGAVAINTKEDVYTAELPHIQLDNIQLFFKNIYWNEYAEKIDNYSGLPISGTLTLSNDNNHMAFSFSSIGYTLPENIKYQWKLEGLDRDWTPPSSINEAIYPNIPPGKYALQLKVINAAGLSTGEPFTYHFSITKPFYQSRAFTFFAIIFTFVSAYFYYINRVNSFKRNQQRLEFKVRQRTKEIEEQNEKISGQSKKLSTVLKEIDEKNQALLKAHQEQQNSLAYARKIQHAIMYSEEKLKESLPQSFIFFQPKELVSSDFYWVKEYEDYIFIILVDCTGHGVPGAFLSMIGFEYLTEIIDIMHIHDPALILKELNTKISVALKQAQGKELVDGMDVAICRINKKANTFTFSGARRPLHYVQNNELHVIRGNFSGAGINLLEEEPVFENVHIGITPDTTLFLFSDGYPNQFNSKGEKFKISNFKKLLLKISMLSSSKEQVSVLRNSLEEWVGDNEQLDDVMVIGFRYYNSKLLKKNTPRKVKNTDNRL